MTVPPPLHRPGKSHLLQLALLFALGTGFIEGAFFRLRPLALDIGPDVLWMAPIANIPWFLLAAVVLWAIGRVRGVTTSPALAAGVFSFLSFLALIMVRPKLHPIAATILAVGIGVLVFRIVSNRETWLGVARRVILPLLALAVPLIAISSRIARQRDEGRAEAELQAARQGAPNVLLLVLDTVRAMSLSLYGYPRPTTPILDQLKSRGVVFETALAPSPWTLPSHASMFTGRLPHFLSSDYVTPLDGSDPTLGEALRAHGYLTAGFVANLSYTSRHYGLSRGFIHYEDFSHGPGEFFISSSIGRMISGSKIVRRVVGYYDFLGRKSARDVNREFLEWQGEDRDRPFFVFLNYFDAHQPFFPPEEFSRQFASAISRRNHLMNRQEHYLHQAGREWRQMDSAEVRRERDEYDAAIRYLDSEIGSLLSELERRGVLQNTLVIITSDHGEQFGEHGLFSHGNSLMRPVLEVPLLLIHPSLVPQGRVETTPVGLTDLAATVMELIGDTASGFEGSSWSELWAAESLPGERPVFSYLAEWEGKKLAGVLYEGRQYIRSSSGRETVYDFKADSGSAPDLAADSTSARLIARFRPVLDSILRPRLR